MTIEIKPSELHNINEFEHILSSDGLSYEKETYVFDSPKEIELKSNDNYGYVQFNKKVIQITINKNIISSKVKLKVYLTNNTEIGFDCYYLDYYTIIII